MPNDFSFTWLGGAGVLLETECEVLAIDPFFSRPGFANLFWGRPVSRSALGERLIPLCSAILVTHSHYDHLMDVADVALRTGATVFGSGNTCRICLAQGLISTKVTEISLGMRFNLGELYIEVLSGFHGATPLDFILNKPLRKNLQPPLPLVDYRKDSCFGFYIEAGGKRFLFGTEPREADCWFFYPMYTHAQDIINLGERCPKVLVPIHWDDMFRPLEKGIRPGWELPTWKPPFLIRTKLSQFKEEVEKALPAVCVNIPEQVC